MNEHKLRKILEGNGGATGKLLRALLYAPGKLYGAMMAARRRLYERGTLPSAHAGVPTISIGNITAGGSGKTPFTALLANHLIQNGKTPAILLRGYRAQGETGSDEATLYKKLTPGAIIKTGSNRTTSAAQAIQEGANVLLMDDGFQHLKLQRDLDIVLIDATSPWGGGNAFPGGFLREPLTALSRAGILVITRADQTPAPALKELAAQIQKLAPGALLFTARHAPARLRVIEESGEERGKETLLPPETLRGKKVTILSGIARPEAFKKTLTFLGATIADEFIGNDHQHFPQEFLVKALSRAKALNAPLVTTEKDEAKDLSSITPLWILGIDQEIDNAPSLFRSIDEVVNTPICKV